MQYLTPRRLQAIYEMLLAFPPFCRWKMPAADKVDFVVLKDKDVFGDWSYGDDHHQIRISRPKHAHFINIVITMAHEMVHLHQYESGTYKEDDQHGASFEAEAQRICDLFGFDSGLF